MTRAQGRALNEQSDTYLVSAHELQRQVSGSAKAGIEIGYGMGHALLDWALSEPEWRLAGIDLYEPGIGACIHRMVEENVSNVVLLNSPAQEVLAELDPGSIDEIRIFFPDPWPKKRHHKRRLIQPDFVALLADVLVPGGVVRLATDWMPYAEWIEECFAGEPRFQSGAAESVRDVTRFEDRGLKLGHEIRDFVFVR